MEKCFEDARQDEKHVPDLLEPIMRPTDPVKEELRQNLFQTTQFDPKWFKLDKKKKQKKQENHGFNFWILEIQSFRAAGQCQPSH